VEHRLQKLKVRTLQGAVLCHVGENVPAASGLIESVDDGIEVTTVAGPAACGEGSTPHIEPNGDGVAVLGDDMSGPFGIFEGCGTEVDALGAGLESGLKARIVTDSA